MVYENNMIWNATQGWKSNRRVQVYYNTSEGAVVEYRVGRTAMIDFETLVFRNGNQEVESRHLGRWFHMTVTGKKS